jgi:NACHT domain
LAQTQTQTKCCHILCKGAFTSTMVLSSTLITLGTEVLKELFKETLKARGSSVIERLDFKVDTYLNILGQGSSIQKYVNNFLLRHGKIKVLGMREGKAVEEIYTTSYILSGTQDADAMDSIDNLFSKYEATGNLYSLNEKDFKKIEALEYIASHPRVVVLGGPGAGKTTLLKKIGIEFLKGKSGKFPTMKLVPVFIQLKDFWRKEEISIKKLIAAEFSACHFPKADVFTDILLEQGRLVISLDAIDEAPSEKKALIIKEIQDFADTYSKNRFIISCREPAYRRNRLSNFIDVEIARFENGEIRETIEKWFLYNPVKGEDCWKKLASKEYKPIKQLANTPLFLTLICILFAKTGQFPSNRSTLYDKALRVLLEEWREDQGVQSEHIYQGLDTRRKEIMLASIAYASFCDERLFIYQRWLTRKIEEILSDMLSEHIDGRRVLEAIEIQHGIFIKQAEAVYSFSHESLQEFLAAQHISESFSRTSELIDKHITSPKWQEIFLYIAGLKEADDLLTEMEKKANTFVSSPQAENLLKWISQKTAFGNASQFSPLSRRVAALHILATFSLFSAKTTKRADSIKEVIKTSQDLLGELDESEHRKLSLLLKQIRILIGCLMRLRGASLNSGITYQASSNASATADLVAAAQVLLRQSRAAAVLLEESGIFLGFSSAKLLQAADTLSSEEVLNRVKYDLVYCQRFLNEIVEKWLRELEIGKQLLQPISSQDFENLERYLQSLYLMSRCKKAAVQLTQQKWQEITNRMLFSKWIEPSGSVGWH